jgi:hypothetical protein
MCEITSMGEMSAARMTMPGGLEIVLEEGPVGGSLRTDLTTSFTPRLSVLFLAAVSRIELA